MPKHHFAAGRPDIDDYDPNETISEYEHDIAMEHGMYDSSRDYEIDEDLDDDEWEKEYEEYLRNQSDS